MGLRRSISGVRVCKPIGNLKMMAVLVPKLRMTLVTAPSRPAMMEPTPMMVPVPMITPSTVRNERILCSRTVASARPIAELSSTQVIVFHPQGFDRIQLGGALRRINSEEQSDGRGKAHADAEPPKRAPPWEPA